MTVTLSGMSNMQHIEDNLRTYETRKPLNEEEREMVFHIAEGLKNAIPCTACRYCTDGCPAGLDIPTHLAILNDLRFAPSVNTAMYLQALPDDKKPSACIGCGKCSKSCPQNIEIPKFLQELSQRLDAIPSWAEICRQREEAQRLGR